MKLEVIVKTILVWGLLSLCLTSCGVETLFMQNEAWYLSETLDFRLKGKLEPGAVSDLIDPNALYVEEYMDDGENRYHYYRFWEDGHVLYVGRALYHLPDRENQEYYERLSIGAIGYYTIEEQTVLMELMMDLRPHRYVITEAEIRNGDLVRTRWWVREHPEIVVEEAIKLRKIDMGELTRQPDW